MVRPKTNPHLSQVSFFSVRKLFGNEKQNGGWNLENKEQAQQVVYKEPIDSLMQKTQSSIDGLSTSQAKEKLERDGLN